MYTEKTISRRINENEKFIMIGNNIDGFVNFTFQEFENFQTVKEKLNDILISINGCGEWDVKLYQVPHQYKICRKYEYYQVPKPGKLIFEHSYMNDSIKKVVIEEDMLIFIGYQVFENNAVDKIYNLSSIDISFEVRKLNITK